MEVTPKSTKLYSSSSPCGSVESSPCGHSQQKQPHQQLSSSLKARLKRSRRSFTSPLSVAKRLCVDDSEEDVQRAPAGSLEPSNKAPVLEHDVDVNRNETKSGSERISGPVPESTHLTSGDVIQRRAQLRKELKDKTETLRRLKMVKMYRSKNDLTQLQSLIDKWRSCSQAALCELQSDVLIDGHKASLPELMDLFGLDDRLLHFDRTEEDFTT